MYADIHWPVFLAAGFVTYRPGINMHRWFPEQPIDRIL